MQWNPRAPYWLDAGAFQRLCQQPTRLAEAVDLYRGPLLPAVDEEWLWFERERLRSLSLNSLLSLIQTHRRARNYAQALRYAQQALAEDPLREDVMREEMRTRLLAGPQSPARLVTLTGVGGIGKTQFLDQLQANVRVLPARDFSDAFRTLPCYTASMLQNETIMRRISTRLLSSGCRTNRNLGGVVRDFASRTDRNLRRVS